MGIKVIYGYNENGITYSKISEYPQFYLDIKNSIKNNETKEYYTDNLSIFKWSHFLDEMYPSFIEFIKTKKKKKEVEKEIVLTEPKCTELKEWKRWITQEYFPYKEYLFQNKKNFPIQYEKYILKFSDYYYSNYTSIKHSLDFINNIFHRIDKNIKGEEISIALVIDNFNFSLKNILCSYFKEQEINIYEEDFYFTTLPSETLFGKQALLSLSSLNFNKNWNVGTLKELKKKFNKKNVVYINQIAKLKEINFVDNTLYIVNYLRIDEILHTDNLKYVGDILDNIKLELKGITELIKFLLEIDKKIGVYIMTDHGSIKVPASSKKISNQIINDFGKNWGEIIGKLEYREIIQNRSILEKYGYILEKSLFFLDEDYYIAKPGVYFKDINEEKYLHGGISPDEICIPFLKINNYTKNFHKIIFKK